MKMNVNLVTIFDLDRVTPSDTWAAATWRNSLSQDGQGYVWRHGERANFAFLDGHVQLLSLREVPLYRDDEAGLRFWGGNTIPGY